MTSITPHGFADSDRISMKRFDGDHSFGWNAWHVQQHYREVFAARKMLLEIEQR